MERPRRSPWEGLAPGSPASAGGRSRVPSRGRGPRRSERSAPRAARPPAADGRRPAVSCREGRDGSWDTCESPFPGWSLPHSPSAAGPCAPPPGQAENAPAEALAGRGAPGPSSGPRGGGRAGRAGGPRAAGVFPAKVLGFRLCGLYLELH